MISGTVHIGQRIAPQKAEILCKVTTPDPWCHTCGGLGVSRDTVTSRLAHAPFGWCPTVLMIRHRRYRCNTCHRVLREDIINAAAPRQKISHIGLRRGLNVPVT